MKLRFYTFFSHSDFGWSENSIEKLDHSVKNTFNDIKVG